MHLGCVAISDNASTSPSPNYSGSKHGTRSTPVDENGVAVASVAVASCPGCCVLDCPRLDCTRAIGLCFHRPTCPGVEIGFGLAGRAAVARLRVSS